MLFFIRSPNRARIKISDDISHFKWFLRSLSTLSINSDMMDNIFLSNAVSAGKLCHRQVTAACIRCLWRRVFSSWVFDFISVLGLRFERERPQRNFCAQKGREYNWCLTLNGESIESQAACIDKLSGLFP